MHNGQRLPIREPIFSVQQQSYFHVREKEQLICKSNHSDQCYRHYLGRHLAIGFGQLREVEYEKVEFSKPSLVILSPTLEIDEIEIVKRTDKLVSSLEQMKQYRKRYAIVHADQNSYIIGGYVFDPLHRVRLSYVNDYKYDAKTGALQPMVPLPTLAVGFGLAIGDNLRHRAIEILICSMFRWEIYRFDRWSHARVRSPDQSLCLHVFLSSNRALSQCHIMNIKVLPEQWTSLPDLPVPTVNEISMSIHLMRRLSHSVRSRRRIAGRGNSCDRWIWHLICGEHHARRLLSALVVHRWSMETANFTRTNQSTNLGAFYSQRRCSIRTTYLCSRWLRCDHQRASCGGTNCSSMFVSVFSIHITRVADRWHLDDEEKKNWKLITIIHHLKLSHALSFYDDKLHISELILKGHEEYDNQIIRSYDFKSNQWIEPAKK